MWTLFNRTPYAADRNWTRDKTGAHWWIVAVRATFNLAPGGHVTLADEQLPPVLAPEYHGAPGTTSIKYDSDLLAPKPSTDLLLVANAHAPGGRAVPTVPVRLRVGGLQKELRVHGERKYRSGVGRVSLTAPTPFTTCPIRYELAYGGIDLSDPDPRNQRIDERNPVGRGVAARREQLVDRPGHRIEYAGGDPASTGPAGFGPLDASWLPRRTLAGTYDAQWEKTKKPLLPDDYDPTFALSAPADQRLNQPLVGGERVELAGMSRDGILLFDLPRPSLSFTSSFGSRREPHESSVLTTVLIEPEEQRLSLVWQSTLRVPAPDVDYLDATEITAKGGRT